MSRQSPLPYAFAQRSEFMALAPENRTRHLWEAHEFCVLQMGQGRFADAELKRNMGILGKMMLDVAKLLAARLRQEGTWSNPSDKRWPRNHQGGDPEHMYDTGAYPPQIMTFPSERTSWRLALQDKPEEIFNEMIAWAETPAGKVGIGEVEMQKLLADRDTYLPHAERAGTPTSEEDAFEKTERESQSRVDGMGWLWDKSADGSLSQWAHTLKLEKISAFLTGSSSNRRPMERLLPELMAIERAGEWEKLAAHLEESSLKDAVLLSQLRDSLPMRRQQA